MRRLVGDLLLAVVLLVLTTLVAVQWVAYDADFISGELLRLNSPQVIGMRDADVYRYAEHTAAYLRGSLQDPNLGVALNGAQRWLLNEREVLHMQDVQQLFIWARYFLGLLILVLILWGLWACRWGRFQAYLGTLKRGAIGAILIGALFALLISNDFNQSFTLFHLLSFSNDLWLLDPATDLLINLLPEQFFATAALQTALRAGALLLLLALLAYLASRESKSGSSQKYRQNLL